VHNDLEAGLSRLIGFPKMELPLPQRQRQEHVACKADRENALFIDLIEVQPIDGAGSPRARRALLNGTPCSRALSFAFAHAARIRHRASYSGMTFHIKAARR
jgi:hypothetical protein